MTSIDVDDIVTNARRNGLRIIGPSSFGIASPRPETALQAALVDVDRPGRATSPSRCSRALWRRRSSCWLSGSGVGLSWFVSLGDKADISANDLLQFWEDDDATNVITLYTESLGNPRKFARIARRVAATKPIVAVRTGAALVGTANAALYEQTGVIQVPTVVAMLDTARVLATQPLMNGDRVAVVSNAKSPFVLTAATLDAAGLEVANSPRLDWRTTPDDYADALRAAARRRRGRRSHRDPRSADVRSDRRTDRRHRPSRPSGAAKPIVAVMLGSTDGQLSPRLTDPDVLVPRAGRGGLEPCRRVLRVAAGDRCRGHRCRVDPDRSGPRRCDRRRAPRHRHDAAVGDRRVARQLRRDDAGDPTRRRGRCRRRPPARSATRSPSRRSLVGSDVRSRPGSRSTCPTTPTSSRPSS